jgi:hypothetical protein
VSVPLLILDPDLKVLSADARFYHVFRTTRGKTENKRIYGLGKGQRNIRRLPELLEQIVPNNNSVDDFEVEHVFSGIGFKKMSLSAHLSRGKLQCRHDSHLHGRYYRFKLTWQRVHSHSHGIYNSND